jgi:hypothetical protein
MADCSADGLTRGPAVRDQPAREELELASEIMGPVNAARVAEGWSGVLGPVNRGCGGGERTVWGIMGPVNARAGRGKGGAEFWDQ